MTAIFSHFRIFCDDIEFVIFVQNNQIDEFEKNRKNREIEIFEKIFFAKSKFSKFFFREIEFFFCVFDIPRECRLRVESFIKISRGDPEL